MGFLERAIRRGVSDAVGKAIGKAIEPTVTDLTNKAANAINQAAQNTEQQVARSSGLEGTMANLERSVQGYSTEAAKNMKVCPNCNKPTTADKKFCPECGTQLPVVVQEEQMHADDHASIMSKWDKQLPQYPKWNCGGSHFEIEVYDGFTTFSVNFDGNTFRAKQAVEQHHQLLLEGGFREAGENPTIEHLYKMIDGVCYHADTEHCFEGDNDTATIYFNTGEPQGGFYYKPDKKSFGLKGLFGI